ncbi:class I tRNA ligase family protein [Candidatus Vidania fulgoroideae]|uniref:Class I tRNA ligase family protein n=1 Tax=Candidatus Vidania fulgoroideorum TaxID=881286 RepID=A0AAX3NC01_9PROT|nr:class I tRNA ligase family protein [Candidatus Vidania fulgoroideae]
MKETLNIIKNSKFKVNINFRKNEIENLKKLNLFSKKKKKIFILHDGPPYANGEVHLGHCINKILKDFILRSKTLFGYYTPFIMGWDCHGIPIEIEVKKKKIKNNISFKKECIKYSNLNVEKQKDVFKKLAIYNLVDFYKTTDFKIEEKEIRIFHFLLKKKKIFFKKKKNNWCFICNSTISYHEIVYKKSIGIILFIKDIIIRIKNIKKLFFLKKIYTKTKKNSFFINPLTGKKIKIIKKNKNKKYYKINNNKKKVLYIKNNKIIQFLKNKKLEFKIFKNKVKVCWRHNLFTIIKKTKQFFLKFGNKIKKNINRLVDKLICFPKNAKKNLKKIINNRKEWVISRQRKWGVPMCLFKKKNKFFFKGSKKIYKKLLYNIKKKGIIYWDKEKIVKKKNIKKIKDTLDVWFDSGLTHTTVLNRKKIPYSADLYVEGYDQYRGWFNSSIITSFILYNKLPFKEIFVHGFALDKNGKKMSKSKNNVIKPSYIIDKYGVDILRLYISIRNLKKDIKFSENDIISAKKIYLKFRNTFNFLINNIYNLNKKNNKILDIDKYFYIKTKIKINKIIYNIKKYNFHKAIKIIENFFIKDLSNKFFEILKDRIYILNKNSKSRISAQIVLKYIGKEFSKILFIFTPFLSNETWNFFSKKKVTEKKIGIKKISKKKFYNKWKKIFVVRKKILDKIIFKDKNYLKKIKIIIKLKKKEYNIFKKYKKEIKYLFLVRKVLIKLSFKNNFKIIMNKNIKKCSRCWRYYKKIKKTCLICKKIINKKKVERKYI